MRKVFENELKELNEEMIRMSDLCTKAISTSVEYLMNPSADRKGDVAALVEECNHTERTIENMSLRLLMEQQPVAGDLRVITAALKMVSDMEIIADNADDIADIVAEGNITEGQVGTVDLSGMAEAAMGMLTESISAFVNKDEAMARKVIEADDVVDNRFTELKKKLAVSFRDETKNLDALLDLFMIAKYFERIGDHSVNVGQWVVYMTTGELVGNTN